MILREGTTTATSSISYLSPPPLLASSASSPPSHPHYQEQALPLKRELVDTVRHSRSAFLLSFGISAKLNKRLSYWWTIAGELCWNCCLYSNISDNQTPFLGQLNHWLSATLVVTKRSPQKSASASKKKGISTIWPWLTQSPLPMWLKPGLSPSLSNSHEAADWWLRISSALTNLTNSIIDQLWEVWGRILDANHLPFYLKFHLSKHHPHSPPASWTSQRQ